LEFAYEIHDFYQDDLISKDLYIVDTYFELYVWIGEKASEQHKRMAMEIANEYKNLEEIKSRSTDLDIHVIQEGREPISFKCCFHAWKDGNKVSGQTSSVKVEEALRVFYKKYSYSVLVKNPPKECDKTQLEVHLEEAEFEQVFKMTKAEWSKLANWKRLDIKRQVGLF